MRINMHDLVISEEYCEIFVLKLIFDLQTDDTWVYAKIYFFVALALIIFENDNTQRNKQFVTTHAWC